RRRSPRRAHVAPPLPQAPPLDQRTDHDRARHHRSPPPRLARLRHARRARAARAVDARRGRLGLVGPPKEGRRGPRGRCGADAAAAGVIYGRTMARPARNVVLWGLVIAALLAAPAALASGDAGASARARNLLRGRMFTRFTETGTLGSSYDQRLHLC